MPLIEQKLTVKQQAFAAFYIELGNATEAYLKAYPNVKKEATARAAGSRMLTNVSVKSYIDNRMEELKSERVADQQEVLEYLTSVMRGEVQDEMLLVIGDETGTEVERHEKRSDTVARTKAAELLGKRYRMWIDKVETDGKTKVVIVDDV